MNPIHATYVGTDPLLTKETALVQGTSDPTIIIVQVDRFEHPWSHGWHSTPTKDWRPDRDV